jgi:hypothetical protein
MLIAMSSACTPTLKVFGNPCRQEATYCFIGGRIMMASLFDLHCDNTHKTAKFLPIVLICNAGKLIFVEPVFHYIYPFDIRRDSPAKRALPAMNEAKRLAARSWGRGTRTALVHGD